MPVAKIITKRIIEQNAGAKTRKLSQESINLNDLGLRNGFLDVTPNVKMTKERR